MRAPSRPAPWTPLGRVLLYIAEATALTQYRPPEDDRSGAVATASYALGAVARLMYDPATAMLYAGTATATTAGTDTIKRVQTTNGQITTAWATGFTRVGGLAMRGAAHSRHG